VPVAATRSGGASVVVPAAALTPAPTDVSVSVSASGRRTSRRSSVGPSSGQWNPAAFDSVMAHLPYGARPRLAASVW
jgi:hypothetical protein